MGKKLSFSSLLFRFRDAPKPSCYTSPSPSSSSASSWPWPSCKNPKTSSFRDGNGAGAIYKTINSVYFDSNESCFTHSSEEHESFSTVSEEADSAAGDSSATLVRRLRSDRLFFEPGDTSSILDQETTTKTATTMTAGGGGGGGGDPPFEDSVAMAMESEDPYGDFRRSMEEMVVAHGIKDWEQLEALLVWYLKVNGKMTHGFIVGAFVDLLVALSSASPPFPSSSSSSSSSSNSFKIEEIKEEETS
ncbi:hypothetical protein Cni_G21514 [Canna indica]|uniref:Transcription repressor n=1 Tax=Canna indica TaxID=4628 RepID=A0AAQ3KPN5_9LILI|nr:hypothetical protein Cni_G21514 [Canna indica]